jgi:DNA-directed RNA polymerase subunit RPC12/RpoP
MKKFQKNDSGFICINCGFDVPTLGSSSRDHCTKCLHGLHVDINPGDRANTCRGTLKPTSITADNRKGYVIHFMCLSCGEKLNNKAAHDDNFEEILRICKRLS